MKHPEHCTIEYCGYSKPETPDEIDFEILGLENAIDLAKARISALKQSTFLANNFIKEQIAQEKLQDLPK